MACSPMAWARWLLPTPGRPNEKQVAPLADELSGGQIVNLLPFDRAVEAPIKVFQCFGFAEAGPFAVTFDQPLCAHIEFVLEDQLQKLRVRQLMALRFAQAQFQTGE